MLLGKIFGKVTTKEFKFLVEHETHKFEYIQIFHPVYEYVLCQVMEIEKQEDMTTASCQVVGYKDKEGKIKKIKIPFEPGSEVFLAENKFIGEVIKLEESDSGAYIGKLDGRDINIYLDLKKLLTKHVAILAKSGSGKSYTVGVLLEEIIAKKVPLLIIDPHGEYSSMRLENNHLDEIKHMSAFGIKPEKFIINEYGETTLNPRVRPLKISSKLSAKELIEMLPVKLSSSQLGVLYSATQNMKNDCDFDSVLYKLQEEESNIKWNLISIIEQLRDTGLFSPAPTPYHELVKSQGCSIINFRGIPPEIQDIIVYKLTKDLFELRKQNKIPPFFLVVEEAHNYCPERSFGEKKSSKILRTIASEGRKFGLGLCVVSQRPARVDKSVISQCSTQIIMKITNPNDLKAVSSSVEGITSATEKEVQDISIGTALITGITDVPLFVRVRPRKSLHGGHAVDILSQNGNPEQYSSPQNNVPAQTEKKTSDFSKVKPPSQKTTESQTLEKTAQAFQQTSTSIESNQSFEMSSQKENLDSDEKNIIEQLDEFKEQDVLPLLKPTSTSKDIALMSEKPVKTVHHVLLPVFVMTCKDGENVFKLWIDRTTGEIIINKETAETKKLPDLGALSKKELRMLQAAFKLKKFSIIDMVHALGVNLDLKKELDILVKKTYILQKDDTHYELNSKFIFSSLEHYKLFDELVYESISYSQKIEPSIDIDTAISQLEKFTSVIDHAKAFLLTFNVEYE